jgi:hypothetical protein
MGLTAAAATALIFTLRGRKESDGFTNELVE